MGNFWGNSALLNEQSNLNDIRDKGGISGGVLKIIAIFTMAIDHTAAVFYQSGLFSEQVYNIMRCIGRIAFPIFCFLLVEGFLHTRNRKNYLIRLTIFAFISEIPFDLAFSNKMFDFYSQNVFFTLAIGFAALMFIEKFKNQEEIAVIGAGFAFLLANLLKTDYSGSGIILIILFYLSRRKFLRIGASLFLFAQVLIGYIEIYALVALVPIGLYNGKRGFSLKYIFYIFYPAHLLLLYFILHQYLL